MGLVYRVSEIHAPPGGYDAKVAKTGVHFQGEGSFYELTDKLLVHFKANEVPFGEVMAKNIIHRDTAMRLLENEHYDHVERLDGVPVGMEMLDWLKGSASWVKAQELRIEKKPIFVGKEEANRRALVCIECPHHVPLGKAKGMLQKAADGLFKRMTGGRTTDHDEFLGKCSVCKCTLPVGVHWIREVFQADLSEKIRKKFPSDYPCWKK